MGDRVLVIGGSRGTGLLTAHLLLERGHRVRVLARDPAEAAPRLNPTIELIAGDITKPDTLGPAVQDANAIVFTAGVHSGRIARESLVRATDYQGVLNTLAAARDKEFAGRFLYMNSIGVTTQSPAARLLNFLKRNTLIWRRRVEEKISSQRPGLHDHSCGLPHGSPKRPTGGASESGGLASGTPPSHRPRRCRGGIRGGHAAPPCIAGYVRDRVGKRPSRRRLGCAIEPLAARCISTLQGSMGAPLSNPRG